MYADWKGRTSRRLYGDHVATRVLRGYRRWRSLCHPETVELDIVGHSPDLIAGHIAALLTLACGEEYQTRHDGFDVLLICPPVVKETGILKAEFAGGAAKSAALAPLLASLADARGTTFLNAADHIVSSDIDGVHVDPDDHVKLAKAVAALV